MTTTADIQKLAFDTDTKLAVLHNEDYALQDKLARVKSSIFHYADAKYYYRGRQRVTDMTYTEAVEKVRAGMAVIEAHMAANSVTEDDGWVRTDWTGYTGLIQPRDKDRVDETFAKIEELSAQRDKLAAQIEELEEVYRQHFWSRFFLVVSSPGHIHSSTYCSTCRITTRYGWLPELSGHTEEEAVAKHGPALCTVCFPSAPLEWTGDKIKKAAAAKAAA